MPRRRRRKKSKKPEVSGTELFFGWETFCLLGLIVSVKQGHASDAFAALVFGGVGPFWWAAFRLWHTCRVIGRTTGRPCPNRARGMLFGCKPAHHYWDRLARTGHHLRTGMRAIRPPARGLPPVSAMASPAPASTQPTDKEADRPTKVEVIMTWDSWASLTFGAVSTFVGIVALWK